MPSAHPLVFARGFNLETGAGREGGGICAVQELLKRLVVHYTPHQRPMASMSTLVGQNGGGGGGGAACSVAGIYPVMEW